MKRIIALLLILMLLVTSCNLNTKDSSDSHLHEQTPNVENITSSTDDSNQTVPPEDNSTENNEPENNQPENNQPENNQPENNQPENNEPENNQPENNQPENNEPENNQPENNEPENNQPENNQPENNQPENNEPENNQPENNQPENNQPENNQPENNQPENNQPENNEPENNQPEVTHNYKATVTAPTCESAGYTTYTCSDCGDSYVADNVASLGHDIDSTVTAPTCENVGYTTYVCITCSYTYVGNHIDALGHNWKDATTEAPKTCQTCGDTEGDVLPGTSSGYSETLYVHYINVGQGDSIFIQVGDCDILIDAGTANYGSTVSSYLKGKKVDDIELLINTHPDADHCGGLTQVLKDHVVEEVWISKDTSKTTAAYKNFVSAISSEGLTAKKPNKGTVYTYEYLTITVLYSAKGSDSNNSSIVVMLEYGSFRFLFTGDIGEEVETQLVSSGADLDCDVLKVGHHGSKYSSTAAFLSAVSADYGVICVGSNSYGHPTSQALNRLSSAGVDVYRTDKNGNVVFSTNGATLTLPNGTTDSTGSGSGVSSGGSSSSGSSSSGSSSGGSSSGDSSSSTQYFIGNTESKVFHLPTCSNLPSASKQNTMYDYWWIINIAGYTPCGRCLKNYSGGVSYIANATTKVYHVSSCAYLPSSSNRVYITSTAGYTACGHCIK